MASINMHSFLKKLRNRVLQNYKPMPFFTIGLCEFPKSGITMFKYGLSQMLLATNCKPTRVTWFNQNLIIPDIHLPGAGVQNVRRSFGQINFIKTHTTNQKQFNAIILIKRDPFDVMISWYEYSKTHFGYDENFEQFLQSKKGLGHYQMYMASFHEYAAPWQKIIAVYYDDVVEQPAKVYRYVSDHLGFAIPENTIEGIAKKTKRQNMISDEDCYNQQSTFRNEQFVKNRSRDRNSYWDTVDNKILNQTLQLKKKYYDKS